MTTCRVCIDGGGGAGSAAELVPIFSKLEDEFIANLIVECCGVQIIEDDGLPAQICATCLADLRSTNSFVRKVRASDQQLRRTLHGRAPDGEDGEDSPWNIFQVDLDELKQEEDGIYEDEKEAVESVIIKRRNLRQRRKMVDQSEPVKELNRSGVKGAPGIQYSSECSEQESDKRQIKRRKRNRNTVEQSTESETDSEPINKKRRKPRARKVEPSIDKHEDSDDDQIFNEKLQELYRTVNIESDTQICCACLRVFKDRDELVEHGKAVHNKKKYVNESKTNICDVCFRRYSKPCALETHKQSFVGLEVVYECCRCLTRVTDQNRRQHAKTHMKHQELPSEQEKPKRQQLCCAKDCSASCATEELLLAHGTEVHIGSRTETDDPDRRFECPVCFKRFEKREALTRHRHRMYRTTHQCAVCGKEFKTRYEVLLHERNHDNIKPYPCEICGKKFNSKEAVRIHMLVHSDDKPFACTICGWRFRRKCNLNKHALKHREDTPFQCNLCQKTFKGKYHLQYHMRIHTGSKPWQCRYCEKSFADHANRRRHETSHTGIKPYQCSYCEKSFIRKRFQIEHESTHTGIKPYRCEMCNRTFSQKTALKKHLDMHPLAPENQLSLSQPSPMPPQMPMSPAPPPPDQSMAPPPPPGPVGHNLSMMGGYPQI